MAGAVPPSTARPLEQAARVPRPVCPGCGRCGRGDPAPAPQCAPLRAGVARCGGGGRASPGGVLSTVVRGAWCQALPLPRPPVLWSGQPGFRVPCVPDAVGAGVGTQHRPHSVRPCGPALLSVGVAEGRPWGGVLSTVVRGAWCQALSLPRPPVLWSGQPGFCDPRVPGAVDAGVWTQQRPHSVRPCGPALLAVGVAEGRPRGDALHHCEGRLRSGAVPLPTARPLLGGSPGLVGCVRCVWCLCRACRGAWCRSSLVPLVLPSLVSRCGVVLAVCLPCPLPCARPLLGRWLPLVPFVASLLFTLSSTLLPDMHFFPASALLCVSVFFLVGPGFLL